MMDSPLVELDFAEYDTIEAARMLLKMAKAGQISGMVFAIQLAPRRRRRNIMLGATGRPANDLVVATGLSSILHGNLTQQAITEAHD